ALTGAPRGPLDPSRDLRIGAEPGGPTWQAAGGGPGGVALQPPQPVAGGPVPLQPKALPDTPPTGGAAAAPASEQQLMAQLQQRGVSRVVIVTDAKTGDLTWSCVVPTEPGKQKHCEVRNPRDAVAALQALLAQVEQK
ncbi:MAG TPA: hypothetical protein VFW33_23950, partial [Gemmataceae bacterium]|nr:hypothetical protein [Gemmataceae bacterium]